MGFLSGRYVDTHPWHQLAVYLIVPRSIEIRDKWYEFNASTSIDLVTNIVDLIRVDRNTSAQIRSKWGNYCLARYPWPKICIHDNGGDFTGWEFKYLMREPYIKDVPTTSRNPQANAIGERMHRTLVNVLCVLL